MAQRVAQVVGKALRETGQALDRLGLTISGNESFRDHLSRHRPLMSLLDKVRRPLLSPLGSLAQQLPLFSLPHPAHPPSYPLPPPISHSHSPAQQKPSAASSSFVAPSAAVIGSVTLADKSSIWYGAVVRGDLNSVKIGASSNVQDRAVLTTASSSALTIGKNVTIGHGALLESCSVGDDVLIGQGAIVQAGAAVEGKNIVAAGAVVLPGTRVPAGQLWAGNPAKFIREVTPEEVKGFEKSAASYATLAADHAKDVPQL